MAERNGCMRKLDRFYDAVEGRIGKGFAVYGRFVATYPWKFIIGCVFLNGLLGIGMMRIENEIDTELSYTPVGSQASKDRDKIQDIFPDMSGINFFSHQMTTLGLDADVIVVSKGGNLLKREVLADVKRMTSFVRNITTSVSGTTLFFEDICARTYGKCAVSGELFSSNDFMDALDNGTATYPEFLSGTSGAMRYGSLVADIETRGPFIVSAKILRLGFQFRTDDYEYETAIENWMDNFIQKMEGFSSEYFEIAYSHAFSLDEELSKNITGDIALFVITFTLMITYACVATWTARHDCVGQRVILGFLGVLAAGMAIVGGFGLCAGAGLVFVNIVGVVPFLVIGIGIDDMFILMSGLAAAQSKESVEEKMAETMRTSGVAITITSLTDLLAFLAGASSSFIGVRNFCIYTGVTIIFCYINNATFFAACIALNERRVSGNKHFMTCRSVKSKEEFESEGKSKGYRFCCAGTPPTSQKESESFLDRFPRWLIPKIVLKTPFKVIILIVFAGYFGASVYGCTNLQQGLKLKDLVSEKSYYYRYANLVETHFPTNIPVNFVIDSPYRYSENVTQSNVDKLLEHAKGDPDIDGSFEISWLSTYKQSPYYDDSSEEAFIYNLQNLFLADPRFYSFINDVVIDYTNSSIIASRVYVISDNMKGSHAQGQFMLRMRDIASASELSVFAYNPAFIYFEQFVTILSQTLQSVGIAIASVFLITCIFMPHPLLILYVTVAVVMIMTGIFGFLSFLDLTLSSVTMINIVMSIGFSIDFAAHICHGYMISHGESRDIRVREAITISGAPVFHGAASSVCGIIILAFAKSYIFRAFFKVMGLVIVFGICHALFLLPVVLSLIGPGKYKSTVPAKDYAIPNKDNPNVDINSYEMNVTGNGKTDRKQNGVGKSKYI